MSKFTAYEVKMAQAIVPSARIIGVEVVDEVLEGALEIGKAYRERDPEHFDNHHAVAMPVSLAVRTLLDKSLRANARFVDVAKLYAQMVRTGLCDPHHRTAETIVVKVGADAKVELR